MLSFHVAASLQACHCVPLLRACACVTESTLSHFPATAIQYNDIQGPPSKFAVAMVTVSGFSASASWEHNTEMIFLFHRG